MAYYEYLSPSSEWLAPKIEDSRITVGDHTYASSRIKFALWNPEEKIQIGKFCSFAKDVIIFGGGEHFIRNVESRYKTLHSRIDSSYLRALS